MSKINQRHLEWLLPPEKPLLERGDLHLWRVDLKLVGQTTDLVHILSLNEKTRYHRLLSPERRASYLAGRASLRLILAKYLQLLPEAIRFGYNETGKPYLVNPKCVLDVRFNLSHSGQWMVLGVCMDADLGVDIEEVRPVQKNWALEKLFTVEECEKFAGMPKNEKDAAFVAAWTEKEAAAKAKGVGLGGDPAIQTNRAISIRKQPEDGFTVSRQYSSWFIQFEPAPGYLGCAALQSGENPRVKFYEFSAI
jgi:4'-phosphopantetheinyl transferase